MNYYKCKSNLCRLNAFRAFKQILFSLYSLFNLAFVFLCNCFFMKYFFNFVLTYSTIHYHLELQANPKQIAQKKWCYFSIYRRNGIVPWHLFLNFQFGLLRSNDVWGLILIKFFWKFSVKCDTVKSRVLTRVTN